MQIDWLLAFPVITSGIITGFVLALTGSGGSILAVPLLLYLVGLKDPHQVIGTSALAVSFNAYINLWPHARLKHVHWKKAFIFTGFGIIGTIAGSSLGKIVDGKSLIALFSVLMMAVSFLMLKPKKSAPINSNDVPRLKARLTGTGVVVGAIAGFFGIGGGFLAVPGLIISAKMVIIDAIGTSLFAVGSFGLATALSYAYSGFIDWPVAIGFIASGVIGGWLGAQALDKLKNKQQLLTKAFAILILVIGVYMLCESI